MNEKIDQNPQLQEEFDKNQALLVDELVKCSMEQTDSVCLEVKGNFVIELEFGTEMELKNQVFQKLNEKSQDCPDPQELLNLLNPNAQFNQNMESANPGIDLSSFQGGEGWQKFMDQMGSKHGVDDLGKRNGLPLADQFFGSNGDGGMQVFDLQAELAQMEEYDAGEGEEMDQEQEQEVDLEVQMNGAYVVKKNKQV